MANSAFHLLSEFFARHGYLVVFFGVMLENVGLPIPGETALLFAGFLAHRGEIRIVPAILMALVGATVGASLGFLVGRYGGASVVNRLLKRFPRTAHRYDDAQKKFVKFGPWAVFVARFVTGLRVFAGILAGALGMRFSIFLLFSFAGAACWSVVIGYVGLVFGNNWDTLVRTVGRMDRVVLTVIGGGAMVLFLIYMVQRRKAR